MLVILVVMLVRMIVCDQLHFQLGKFIFRGRFSSPTIEFSVDLVSVYRFI